MMSAKDQYLTLFDYHWDTTSSMLKCAAELDETRYKLHHGFGHGSIHDLLIHLFRADQSWRIGLETGKQITEVDAETYPNLEAVSIGFASERAAWTRLIEGYSSDEIMGEIELTSRRGELYTFKLWRVLQHLIMHGMQHHSELAQLLTNEGKSPGDIDFIFYRG